MAPSGGPFFRDALHLTPQLVGAAQQRDVGGILGIRKADNPVDSVRRAEFVADVELL
jgi:hypothetical protein